MSDINERLDLLKNLLQDKNFLESKGLSNEVNIRIFCYDAKSEMTVRHFTEKLLTDEKISCRIFEHNLYKIFLSICEDKRIINKIPDIEEKKGSHYLLNQLSRVASNVAFVEKMKYEPHQVGDVILITGVGEAFPFVRVHSILDAMQPHFSDIPIVVMYPGTFDGRCVKLFDKLKPNPYYRAFNIV